MRSVARAILAGGLGFAVSLVVAACGGGSGLLSADQSSSISGQLDQISSALQSGNCNGVSQATVNLSRVVAELPPSVNPTLRRNLDQGVSTVGKLANQQCRPGTTTQTTTSSTSSTTPTTTTTTSTTPTTTTSTSPATTTSSTTPPPATTTTSPGTTSTGSGGAGLGGGNGNSGAGGGGGGGAASGGGGAGGAAAAGGAGAGNGNGR